MYNNRVNVLTPQRRPMSPYSCVLAFNGKVESAPERSSKGFCVSGAVRQMTKQSTGPVADKDRARYGTTNRSVQALIERPEQADQKVTRRCWFPDESIPHGHLDCEQTEGLHSWSVTRVTRRSYGVNTYVKSRMTR